MPPKKKGKKGKKGGNDDLLGEGMEKAVTPGLTAKEELLKKELITVTEQLDIEKKKVEELRADNDWLQQEAHKVRVESHEYMSYMEKKTSKRQTAIVTLSDHNKQEIRNIENQKQLMEREFDDNKKALENIMLEKEHLLTKTKLELSDLQEYKDLQTEQLTKIKSLEKDVMHMRSKHSETIQELKSQFLTEKKDFQQNSEFRIQTLEKKANKEAFQCLTEHTNHIKVENRTLRKTLLELIQRTRALHQHRSGLEEQRKQLVREQQYADDLKKLRNARQQKSYKSYGFLEPGHDIEAIEDET